MNHIKKNFITDFLLPWLILAIPLLCWLLDNPKWAQMQWVNSRNSPFFDLFFSITTLLGEGFLFLGLVIFFWFKQRQRAFLALEIFLLSTGISQLLKHLVFPDRLRPLAFFEHLDTPWHFVEGLVIHRFHSFPSGHTTSAFALLGLLAALSGHRAWAWLCLFWAVAVGYSRVYLFQHFPEDALAGSALGIACVGLALARRQWEV
jgi:membrane-associated phospholipid phosphatase